MDKNAYEAFIKASSELEFAVELIWEKLIVSGYFRHVYQYRKTSTFSSCGASIETNEYYGDGYYKDGPTIEVPTEILLADRGVQEEWASVESQKQKESREKSAVTRESESVARKEQEELAQLSALHAKYPGAKL